MGLKISPIAFTLLFISFFVCYFSEGMASRIYPPGLQLNKANASDIEAPFWDLHLLI